MGRYDKNKYRKSKRSRYSTADDQPIGQNKDNNLNVFIVGILLIAAVAIGFFLAKLSDGALDIDTFWVPSDNKKAESSLPMKKNDSTVSKDQQTLPAAGQTNILEYTKPQEQIILPTLDSSDEPIREALTAANPELAAYLNIGQIIRKYMQIANDFAQGIRIEKHLSFLKLQQPFAAEPNGAQLVMAARSYQRYNGLAQVINAIDIPATLAVYKKFRPLLLQVFSEFSYPDGYNLDDIFIKAATEILSAPIIDKPVALVKSSSRYKFADSELEALSPVHKQMLRMGPENTRLIQNKVRVLVGELVNSKG